jgi:phage gp29-like protein
MQLSKYLPTFLRAKTTTPKKAVFVGSQPISDYLVPAASARWLGAGVAYYTLQQVEYIYRNALAGDLQSQWEMFDLMEATWPRLGKNLNQLKDSVLGMSFDVQPWISKGQKKPSPEADRRARLLEEALWTFNPRADCDENDFEDTLRDLLDARGKGHSVLELDWELRQTSLGPVMAPRATRWVHPTWYGYPNAAGSTQLMLKTGGIHLDNSNNSPFRSPMGINPSAAFGLPSNSTAPTDWAQFPDHKFLIGICKNKTGHPLGSALLHTLAPWWAALNFNFEYFLNFCQIFGQPFRKATYSSDISTGDKAKLDAMLANMGSAAWGSFPEGVTIELVEAAKNGGENPQATLINLADKVCDITILRQTLTSDVGASGSLAMGQVHERVLSSVQGACANWSTRIINQQLVTSFCLLNFGDTSEKPYIVPKIEAQDDAKNVGDLLVNLNNAGLEPEDDELPAISERLGFTIRRKVIVTPNDTTQTPEDIAARHASAKNLTLPTFLHAATPPIGGASSTSPTHPSDQIAEKKKAALTAAYRGMMAPVKTIILSSTSAQEAEHRLQQYFSDWDPSRVRNVLEEALQLCAAQGAAAATQPETK